MTFNVARTAAIPMSTVTHSKWTSTHAKFVFVQKCIHTICGIEVNKVRIHTHT